MTGVSKAPVGAVDAEDQDPQLSPELRARLRRTIAGASIGNLMEQYDFAIYGAMAALAFSTLFFSNLGTTAALLASFSTYAVGFLARPLGGVVAGHLGDIYGRKRVLVAVLLVAGVSTTLIGLLPTRETVGVWAAVMLVALRFVQGLSVGGEYGGATLMICETAPVRKRAFYTSFTPVGGAVGIILANLGVLIVSQLPREQFLSWGWRMPFLFAFLLIAVGIVIRLRLSETEAFEDVRADAEAERRLPIVRALRDNARDFTLLTVGFIGLGAIYYILLAWSLSYLTTNLKLPSSVGLIGVLVGNACYIVSTFAASRVSDTIGRKRVILVGAVGFAVYAFPFIAMLDTRSSGVIWVALILAWIMMGFILGPITTLMCEQFATTHRYSGASTSYSLGLTLGGGLSPLIATALFALTAASWSIALFIAISGLLCAAGVALLDERNFGRELNDAS